MGRRRRAVVVVNQSSFEIRHISNIASYLDLRAEVRQIRKPRGGALAPTAQGVITTTDPLGSRSFFCLRARTSRTADGSKGAGVYCMSSWAMAKMLPMTRTARSPAK